MRQCVGVLETASVCELVQANPIREVYPIKFMVFLALGLKQFGIAIPFQAKKSGSIKTNQLNKPSTPPSFNIF